MIKAKRKPIEEIVDSIREYNRILNVGCGGCVSVCLAGGQREVLALNADLNMQFKLENAPNRVDSYTIERQCNLTYYTELDKIAPKYQAIISMACGAGVQLMAERFPNVPVFPAVNTVSIGIDREIGMYEERCRACGECVLGYTGGVCPVTRCAKGLFNGPCGGTNKGKCEVSSEIPCAWVEIYERLKAQNRLHHIKKIRPAMLWQNQTQRTIVQPLYENRYTKAEQA
ncbi:MAG: methylenetetrahydrofolate reductase C-terminal domain-containing protein [Desulfobacterales bacterium]|nr:methylenetetrahydrofolate reductase C-terminal domain-containing protein [Desulfobacterales bacterium]